MKYQYFIARTSRAFGIDAAQRMMARARDKFARMLVRLADIDEDRAVAHKFSGALRRNYFQICHVIFPSFGWPCHGQ